MTIQEFRTEWQRLVNGLGTSSLSSEKLKGQFKEAFQFFSDYPPERWEDTVTACLRTRGRRWFPTLGELCECFDNTEPAPDTMDERTRAILDDHDKGQRLERETREWFEKEVLPSLENTPMLSAKEGNSDDETEGQEGPIGGSGVSGSTRPADKR